MNANHAAQKQRIRRLLGAIVGLGFIYAPYSMAETSDAIDYADVFKTKIFPCIHPTVKLDTVTSELKKEPTTSGDVTTARVQAYYQGLIKKNSIEADIQVRKAGSIRQIKAKVLSDTSMMHASCDLTKDWKDF